MRILSGVQPSGELHLGNYFGAVAQHLELQHEGEALYFIADYHALTTIQDAEEMRRLTRDVAATYVALGLDPQPWLEPGNVMRLEISGLGVQEQRVVAANS
ncbi:MAG: hypothetical protein IIB12_03650 [Chloroflexi bacterium]|nr:hypothetical protein [Chloroflexota bacterium]